MMTDVMSAGPLGGGHAVLLHLPVRLTDTLTVVMMIDRIMSTADGYATDMMIHHIRFMSDMMTDVMTAGTVGGGHAVLLHLLVRHMIMPPADG